jgi:hypothetical protein
LTIVFLGCAAALTIVFLGSAAAASS